MMVAIARYRHRVFIEKLGWDLNGRDGPEIRPIRPCPNLYVAARDASGEIGTARLLPTECPYLLGEVFPQLMGAPSLCATRSTWNPRVSRPLISSSDGDALSQFSSAIAAELLEAVLAEAARHGIRRLIIVSPLGIERLLRR